MNQILHIFRKDVRHHWPEILVTWALIAAYVWYEPRKWANQRISIRFIAGLLRYLPLLMIVSWTFLVARLVQDESLVGDRQFWITRPYERYTLFTAKLLSIVAFIHVPLFIGQIILLRLAHFPVLSSIWGLVQIHFMFILVFLTGALAISVVTSGVGQAALALLIAFLMILGIAGITSLVPNSGMVDDTDALQGIFYIGSCITVILVQYISRKTILSRLILVGMFVLFVLVLLLTPYDAVLRKKYPLATKQHPVAAKLNFDRTLSFAHEQKQPSRWIEDETSLELPFQVADMDAKSIVEIERIRLDLELPSGQQWTSHWRSLSNVISYGRTRTWPNVSMETKFYNGIKDSKVKAKVFLGMRSFRLSTPTTVTVAGDRIGLPGNTQCVDNLSEDWLQCFSALKRPKPIFIMAQLPNQECRVSKEATSEEPWADSPATYYDLEADAGAELDFTPVQDFSIGLSKLYAFEDHDIRLPVCSGTQLLVSKPEFQYAVGDEIDLGEITLSNYHPTYPRKILPPARKPLREETPGALSRNITPEFLPVKLEYRGE